MDDKLKQLTDYTAEAMLKATPPKLRIATIQWYLRSLSAEERLEAISGICKYCGWESTICNGVCMRDE